MTATPHPLALLAFGLLLGACGADDPASQAKAQQLLERAIEASGGQEALSGIASVSTRSRAEQGGAIVVTQSDTRLDGVCRIAQDLTAVRIAFGRAQSGDWRTLDGEAIESKAADSASLDRHFVVVKLGLLTPLLDRERFALSSLDRREGLEWIAVDALDLAGIPRYELGFDPETALISAARWSEAIAGQRGGPREVEARFSEHRKVEGGIMAAHRSSWTIDGELVSSDTTLELRFDPPWPEGHFDAPSSAQPKSHPR